MNDALTDSYMQAIRALNRTTLLKANYWKHILVQRSVKKGRELLDYERMARNEITFFHRDLYDPGFHRYLNKKLKYEDNPSKRRPRQVSWVRSHIKDLTRFVLLDILKQDHPSFRDVLYGSADYQNDEQGNRDEKHKPAVGKKERKKRVRIYYMQLYRLIEEYPELVLAPDSSGRHNPKDRRETIFETPYTQKEKMRDDKLRAEMYGWAFQGISRETEERLYRQEELHFLLKSADPDDIEKLTAFSLDIIEVLNEIKHCFVDYEKPEREIEFENHWLVRQIRARDAAVQVLFSQIRWLVELRWFRQRSLSSQNKMLWSRYELTYSRKDSERVVRALHGYYNNPIFVAQLMIAASRVYVQYGREQVAAWLLEECLRHPPLDDVWKANIYHCLAMTYRETKKSRKMMKALLIALSLWSKMKDHPGDTAVEHSFLAGAYYTMGKTELYERHKKDAEELIKSELLTERRRAYCYLLMADAAHISKDYKWEMKLLFSGLQASASKGVPECYSLYINQRIQDLNYGNYSLVPATGPGRIPHPDDELILEISNGIAVLNLEESF